MQSRRPWYSYLLLFIGILALLAAVFRPMLGVTSVAPGAKLGPVNGLVVQPGGPLDQAGARTGDRWIKGESVEPSGAGNAIAALGWKRGIPRSGGVELERAGQRLTVDVRPSPPTWPVQLAWTVSGILNTGLILLALALFWQRPRDGMAVLLGITLLAAPVFAFPREPRLLSLALATHFFAIFPPHPGAEPGRRSRRLRWLLGLGLYVPLLFLGLMGVSIWEGGNPRVASALFDTMAVAYSGAGLVTVFFRGRRSAPAQKAIFRTLAVAAAAMLCAVLFTLPFGIWLVADQFVPANLLPAALFSVAIGRLVFRLRALPVRVLARRTVQYLLARWTLGTLFLIPGFLLVWRFGQMSVSRDSAPGDIFPLIVWMFLTALLLGKRQEVLRNLDRRFFRDAAATRQKLLQLARDLGRCTDAEGVLTALEQGVNAALRPASFRYWPAEVLPLDTAEGELTVPIQRGDRLSGYIQLGPRQDGEEYTAEERQLLEAAGAQAAVALENARLSAALLARQREELTVRAAGVLAGAEDERRRLAADLHDQVLPELRQIAGEVGRLGTRANGLGPDLQRVEGEIRGAMDSVREVMEALRPSALDVLGLADALEGYLRNGAARREPPLGVTVRRLGPEPSLTPEQSLGLYRIGQEAINNLLKHADASRAGLEVGEVDGILNLVVWDNGHGIHGDRGLGHGLGNMRHRAELVGASIEWRPQPEGGTRVEVGLPLVAVAPSATGRA